MKTMSFTTLEECIECYGRENLVAIDNLKQVIFFCTHGCQPKFVFENEEKAGKLTCWFLKNETKYIYQRWLKNRPTKDDD